MIEVAPNLWVGAAQDEAAVRGDPEWFVVSAAKEPWHRQALGYTGRGAPPDHAEYLAAVRPHHLILNLIDADDAAYVPDACILAALGCIEIALPHQKVLVHCNKGGSRAPTIALLRLASTDQRFAGLGYEEATTLFRTIYPPYAPARGMADYAKQHWPTQATQ